MPIADGRMQSFALTLDKFLDHAAKWHPHAEVVTARQDGGRDRVGYADLRQRSQRISAVLQGFGTGPGDRVATLAWNTQAHVEVWYAIMGMGTVCHTLNPRLTAAQLASMVTQSAARILVVSADLAPLARDIADRVSGIERVLVIDLPEAPSPVESGTGAVMALEPLIDGAAGGFAWGAFDETTPSGLCFTSGTTGAPKGVAYTHRSSFLHTLRLLQVDVMAISGADSVLVVVPMFHANAWGLPYSCAMVGAKLVLPGAALDGKSLHELITSEQVSFAAGVPTIWLGMLQHAEQNALSLAPLKRTIIGGSAVPPSMMRAFEDNHGIEVIHAWGMTEMSPLGTVSRLKQKHLSLPLDEQHALLAKQGKVVFGVDMRIVDPQGAGVPWDGKTPGDLLVRGPWVVQSYFGPDGAKPLVSDPAGVPWFPTGDVATIDADGYMQITDRSKDVIKSGGEWIGSIDLENVAMAHPAVAMAAAIAVPHPKWDERPLLVVVRKPGAEVTREALIEHYKDKVASWWVPDDVVFVDAIPIGATGKMLKNKLREQFKDHRLPGV